MHDHQHYPCEELNRLIQSCDNGALLITTEKDAVKLRAEDFPCPCLTVGLELDFDDPARLDGLLNRLIAKDKR